MVVYSFYIFDRHTECIYSKTWAHPQQDRPLSASSLQPGRPISAASSHSAGAGDGAAGTGSVAKAAKPRSAQDDAKLVFGTVFSLRNMVRKLGGDDDSFISFRTSQYKLHYYETITNLKLVMLTDTMSMSMRSVLHQIYATLYVEFVVKNPLSPVEHPGGIGVRNELFDLALDQFVTSFA